MGTNAKYEWEPRFKNLYGRVTARMSEGIKTQANLFSQEDREFLKSIGAKPIEIFDSVDDGLRYGEPSYEEVLEIHRMKFAWHMEHPEGTLKEGVPTLRDKSAELGGISWLPRAIDKVRAKLTGRLADDYYYPCSGDRRFLKEIRMTAPDFFRCVKDSSTDEEVLAKIKALGNK